MTRGRVDVCRRDPVFWITRLSVAGSEGTTIPERGGLPNSDTSRRSSRASSSKSASGSIDEFTSQIIGRNPGPRDGRSPSDGRRDRPRGPIAIHTLPAPLIPRARASSALAKMASGTGTVRIIRTVPPPSDSGLKLPCSGDSSLTQNSAPRNGQPRHHRTGRILHPVDLDRTECRLVKIDRTRTTANRQQGRD